MADNHPCCLTPACTCLMPQGNIPGRHCLPAGGLRFTPQWAGGTLPTPGWNCCRMGVNVCPCCSGSEALEAQRWAVCAQSALDAVCVGLIAQANAGCRMTDSNGMQHTLALSVCDMCTWCAPASPRSLISQHNRAPQHTRTPAPLGLQSGCNDNSTRLASFPDSLNTMGTTGVWGEKGGAWMMTWWLAGSIIAGFGGWLI